MRTMAIFEKPAGTVVTLRMSNVAASVISYRVFVQSWTDAGKRPIAIWSSDVLEGMGAVLVLKGFRGYDIILKANVSADASTHADLMFDGTSQFNKSVDLPAVEGPVIVREWSIVVR